MKNTKKYGLTVLLLTVISQHVALADSPGERIARAIEDFDSGKNISFEGSLENGLIQAIRDNNCAQAIKYIEKGANPNIRDGFGRTFLHILAYYKKGTPVAKALLDKGADSNSKRSDNAYTPLHSAVYEGNQEMIQLLLKNKADIDAKNLIGDTPLHMAVASGEVTIVKLLLDAGANLNVTNNIDGASPLHHIAEGLVDCYDANSKRTKIKIQNKTEIAKLLVAAGAKKDAKNCTKYTPYGILESWFQRIEDEINPQTRSLVEKLIDVLRIEPLKSIR